MIHDLVLHWQHLRVPKGCLSQDQACCAELPLSVPVDLDVICTRLLACVHDALLGVHTAGLCSLQSHLQVQIV